MRDYSRYDAFINSSYQDVYPEPPSEPATRITKMAIETLWNEGILKPGMKVLDIGCGQGVALQQFADLGLIPFGCALGADQQICQSKGYSVYELDQNFLTFEDQSFDFLWCRHVLEHSVAPLFTISEYYRLTRTGGYVYVEVPAPDTAAHHEANVNHYSVFGHSAWMSLFSRRGFTICRSVAINFNIPAGEDTHGPSCSGGMPDAVCERGGPPVAPAAPEISPLPSPSPGKHQRGLP